MVAPDLQGQGIGSLLMDRIEDLAPPETVAFQLLTGAGSTINQSFYRRRGYVETDTDDGPGGRAGRDHGAGPGDRRNDLDGATVGPVSQGYGGATPQPQRGTGASRTTSGPGLGVVHGQPGGPLGVADDRGPELRVVGEPASSAAMLSSVTKRRRCSTVMFRSRWWTSIRG